MNNEIYTLEDFEREYPNDEACLNAIFLQRWPSGVVCPFCANDKISIISRNPSFKNVKTKSYQCLREICRRQFTSTSGTMLHLSHLPMETWFTIIRIVINSIDTPSAKEIERQACLSSYKTAYHSRKKIIYVFKKENNMEDEIFNVYELVSARMREAGYAEEEVADPQQRFDFALRKVLCTPNSKLKDDTK